MIPEDEIRNAYSDALKNDRRFQFKQSTSKGKGSYYENGICPECSKKTVFVSRSKPWRLSCNRLTKCAWSESTSNIYPEIIDELIRDAEDPENPKAQANSFMKYKRGFDINVIGDWYDQEIFFDKKNNITTPTVRFWLDKDRNCFWERLIGKAKADGQRQNIRGNRRTLALSDRDYDAYDGTVVKGMWWTPPGQTIEQGDSVYLVEGIFHAISLFLCGFKVAATIASGYYPELSIREYYGKSILWIWALDDDNAGRSAMIKHRKRMEDAGELTTMAITGSESRDWDDFYKIGVLEKDNPKFMQSCLERGLLAAAKSVDRKSYISYLQNHRAFYILEHRNSLYSISVQIESLDRDAIETMDIEQEYNHKYVPSDFSKNIKIKKISPCFPQFLYAERNQLTRELSFFMRVDFANEAPRVQETLDKVALETAKSFHKALVGIAAGGAFYGNELDFRTIYDDWFSDRKSAEEVRSVNFMGYDKDFRGYVFSDFGYKNGQFIEVNNIGLIQGDDEKIKTTLKDINFVKANTKARVNWLGDLHTAFGINGLVVLAFWSGAFFSEQLRQALGWFPFLELSGPPGTGKSTIIEYLWKASGRQGRYEGINPTKYSRAGRGKVMTKLSGMPLVMVEGDTQDAKQAFDINEMKDAFNGGPIRGIGLPTGGSETIEPPFKCGFIVAQNDEIDCEKAMISRFVHLHWTDAHFSARGAELLDKFRDMTHEDASAFMHSSMKNEPVILKSILSHYESLLPFYRSIKEIKMPRIQETHALINACYLALKHVFGEQTEMHAEKVQHHLIARAKDRQRRMTDDHPDVVTFWEVYELINNKVEVDNNYVYSAKNKEIEVLNHSIDTQLIAINLTEVAQKAEVSRYRLPLVKDLKKLLHNSDKYKMVDRKVVKSKITGKAKHCWIFRKPKKSEET